MFRFVGLLLASAALFAGAHSASAVDLKGEQPLNAKPHTDGKNFVLGSPLQSARAAHTATILTNGKVLIAGGFTDASQPASATSSAELYSPKTGVSTYTGSMSIARAYHTATLLANGKVLMAGGIVSNYIPTATAELYDPATGSFSSTGSLITGRRNHTATLLGNGQVLITGGEDDTGAATDSAEVYDPASGTFSGVGSMTTARVDHTATMLPSGLVLITGGGLYDGVGALNSAELYDPASETFSGTGSMVDARISHTATLLGSGKVLLAGGIGEVGILSSAELFDPSTGVFTPTGSMSGQRWGHTATLLKSGKVLLTAGNVLVPQLLVVEPSFAGEIYNPKKGAFDATGPMVIGRANAAATLLPNSRVLVSGGLGSTIYNGLLFFYTENVPEIFSAGGGRCTPGTPGCGWRGGDLMTFDQRDWGSGVAMAWLESDFFIVYGGQFELMLLGEASGYSMVFDNGPAVADFMPQAGNPAPLDLNYFDPPETSAGQFGGDMVALKLNIDYSDAGILLGNPKIAFGDLTLCNMGELSALNGLRVRDFLSQANVALSGLPALYDVGTFDGVAQVLNDAFENENASTFAQQNLVNGTCP